MEIEKEVLEWAEKQNFSSFQPQNDIHIKNSIPNYQITGIKELQNENLKNYLQQRRLSKNVYPFIKEVHFKIREKNLYAVGFENLSGGWKLRNSFYKGSLLKKDISVINLNNEYHEKNKNIVVFEGFTDALSFIEMKRFCKGDLLVMNSISLLNKAKDHSKIYFPHKDLNDYLLSRIQIKNENRQQQAREEQQQNCQFLNGEDKKKLHTRV